FYVEPRWRLGNVLEGDLLEMLNSERQREFGVVKTHLPAECAGCEWLPHCWGGCPKDRQRNPASQGANHFCRSYRMFFEHADARLRRLAEVWRSREAGVADAGAKQRAHGRRGGKARR